MYAGFAPFAASDSMTASAIARTCRGLFPDAMRKKSVKPALLRRSSTTRFNACLLPAASIARSICAGSFGDFFLAVLASLFVMQPACRGNRRCVQSAPTRRHRHVKSVVFNVLLHVRRYETGDRLIVVALLADRSR